MKTFLYLDLIGGVAGDMLVGGLLDLGVPLSVLQEGLETLGVPEIQVHCLQEKRHQISGTHFIVKQVSSSPHHRAFSDIKKLILDSSLQSGVKERAVQIFEKLAIAEGAVHDVSPEKVHFHEVGAWDSIADIVGIALCLDYLSIHDIYVSSIPTGSGFVKTAHGAMPIPAPATLKLLSGFEIVQDSLPFERTTPTGAAAIAALAQPQPKSLRYTVDRVGTGIGTKETDAVPNILRCILGTWNTSSEPTSESLECSEANIDDCSPEYLGYVQEQLLQAGALDVWVIPIQMKKNRPGILLQVLHRPEQRGRVHHLIFQETTTIGVRYQPWKRVAMERTIVELKTPWGVVRGKKSRWEEHTQFSPEFEDCRNVAKTHNIPLKDVYRMVTELFWEPTKTHIQNEEHTL